MITQHIKRSCLFLLILMIFSTSFVFAAKPQNTVSDEAIMASVVKVRSVVNEQVKIQKEKQEQRRKAEEAKKRGRYIVAYAEQFLGNPYVWGGTSLTNGTDCSGFTQSVFAYFGISLPRTAAAQASGGVRISENAMKPGDLVFYSNGSRISHVAIYYGDGKIIHASNRRDGIKISKYNYQRPAFIKRYW